jgi:hypothetical protein
MKPSTPWNYSALNSPKTGNNALSLTVPKAPLRYAFKLHRWSANAKRVAFATPPPTFSTPSRLVPLFLEITALCNGCRNNDGE